MVSLPWTSAREVWADRHFFLAPLVNASRCDARFVRFAECVSNYYVVSVQNMAHML